MKFLALGGNLGPVLDTFGEVFSALQARGIDVTAVSAAYRTEAVTWPGTQAPMSPFWNAVCQVQTSLTADAALEACKSLERMAGRVSGPRWGARPLDLDLLLWDDEIRDDAALTLPHPRLHERLFVLRPLHELAPHAIIPTLGCSVRALLSRFDDGWSGIMLRRALWFTPLRQKNASRRPSQGFCASHCGATQIEPESAGEAGHFHGQNAAGELMFCDGASI